MHEIDKLFTAYKLKEVKRTGLVGKRQETTAEHTYSSILLAEYFLKKIKGLDEIKVIRMILYHDFSEIKIGDTFILDKEKRQMKEKQENEAMKTLENELPGEISSDMKIAWKEYSEGKTREAKFCKAIDSLDPIIQGISRPGEWKRHGFTEKKLREYKEPSLKEFPELMKFFNEMITELKKRNVIPKEKN